jgi:hypothetical protein
MSLIYPENLIDYFYKKETFTKCEIVSIMTLTSTYKKNHVYKTEFYNKSNEMIKKILDTYDFKDDELNDFIKEHIDMFRHNDTQTFQFICFDFAKHKFLLDNAFDNVYITTDSIKNIQDAKDFVNNYLFGNKIFVSFENIYKNTFIKQALEEYIEKNIETSEITEFAEKICEFLFFSDIHNNLHKKITLNNCFMNKNPTYKNLSLIIGIYSVARHSNNFFDGDNDCNSYFTDKFKNVFMSFSIIFRADKIYNDVKFANFITQKHLELAFKHKNITAVQTILNLKFKLNAECLKYIFTEHYTMEKYFKNNNTEQLLNIFVENYKITQECFMTILRHSNPKEIPKDIKITDEIIDLYSQKQFDEIKNTISDKEIFEKIITKKINDCNFTASEIKNIYDTLKSYNITLKNINKDNIEKIGNKTIRNNIVKFIK